MDIDSLFSAIVLKIPLKRGRLLQKKSTPLLVVAAALVRSDGSVLLQRRRFQAQHGGLWEFPGGKVERGETPAMALVREIEEELGVEIAPGDLEPLTFAGDAILAPDRERALVILLYTCRRWQGEPECRDGEEIGWFVPAQFSTLKMPPLDYPLAETVIRMI